jgi:hypothetical protein
VRPLLLARDPKKARVLRIFDWFSCAHIVGRVIILFSWFSCPHTHVHTLCSPFLLGTCHMQTYTNKKVCSHMNLRAYSGETRFFGLVARPVRRLGGERFTDAKDIVGKAPRNRFSKKWKENTFFGCSASLH